jgi:hypothetical protein
MVENPHFLEKKKLEEDAMPEFSFLILFLLKAFGRKNVNHENDNSSRIFGTGSGVGFSGYMKRAVSHVGFIR